MPSRIEQRDGKYVAIIEGVPGKKNQEFTGSTLEDVTAQLVQAQEHATKKIESMKANGPPALAPQAPKVQPRQLTADERKNAAAALQAGQPSAVEQISRAEFGDAPDAVRNRLNENAHLRARIQALEVGAAFRREHPEFVANPENEAAVIGYLQQRNLAFDLKNLETAYQDLKDRGEIEILEKPAAQPEHPPARPRQAATGLTGGRSSARPPERRAELTRQELRDMPAAEYRRRMGDPAFAKRVDELMTAKAS